MQRPDATLRTCTLAALAALAACEQRAVVGGRVRPDPADLAGAVGPPWAAGDAGGASAATDAAIAGRGDAGARPTTDAPPAARGDAGAGLPGDDARGSADGPPPPARCHRPLAERLRVRRIDLGNGNGHPCTCAADERVRSIHVAPDHAGAGGKIAWLDEAGIGLAALDADDLRVGAETRLPGASLRGLAPRAEGGAFVLLGAGEGGGEARILKLAAVDGAGRRLPERVLLADGRGDSRPTTGSWLDLRAGGRLARVASGLAAYVPVTLAVAASRDRAREAGDRLVRLDGAGEPQPGGWELACADPRDLALAAGGALGAACVTGGREPAIAWNGKLVGPAPGAEARLGGVVAVSGGAWLALTAARGRPGGSDVALVFVTSDGAATRTVWLTETPEAEESPQLARAGDRIVVGWGLRGAADARLATVSDAGELLEGPVRVPARFAGTEGLAAFPDGDVGWGAAGDRPHQVEIARVAACR